MRAFLLVLALALLIGAVFVVRLRQEPEARVRASAQTRERPVPANLDWVPQRPTGPVPKPVWGAQRGEDAAGVEQPRPRDAIDGERLLRFASAAELEAFLKRARAAGLTIRGVARELGVVRVGLGNERERSLLEELAGEGEVFYNTVVRVPAFPEPERAQSGELVAYGASDKVWMGAPTERKNLGEGVRIALVDTGVADHAVIPEGSYRQISVIEGEEPGGHGTAMMAMLKGDKNWLQGLSQGAEVLAVQALGADGTGTAFDVARGIVAAADAGADILVLSLGGYSDNPVLAASIEYAHDRGALPVAAAGNDGVNGLAYPAAYAQTVAVGSINPNDEWVDFSNTSETLDFVAPGTGVPTTWTDEAIISFYGTSVSNVLGAAAIGAVMSEKGLNAAEALEAVKATANESGPAGKDRLTGAGVVNLERALREPGESYTDLAVAPYYVDNLDAARTGVVTASVTVENQGTTTVGNAMLEVKVDGNSVFLQLGQLEPDDTATYEVRFSVGELRASGGKTIEGRVSAGAGVKDENPANDARAAKVLRVVEPSGEE